MKYKKRLQRLKVRQEYWEKMGAAYQRANKRPGSEKSK